MLRYFNAPTSMVGQFSCLEVIQLVLFSQLIIKRRTLFISEAGCFLQINKNLKKPIITIEEMTLSTVTFLFKEEV